MYCVWFVNLFHLVCYMSICNLSIFTSSDWSNFILLGRISSIGYVEDLF